MTDTLKKRLADADFWLYVLFAYPIIDYVFRKLLPIPVISSLWDDALLIVLLGFTCFACLKSTRKLPGIKHLFAAFFALGAGLIVTDMAHFDAGVEGFRAVCQYMLAFFVGFYLIRSVEQMEKLVRVFVLVGFLVALYGLVQLVTGVETPGSWTSEGETFTTRIFSIVTSPNVLGSYMAFTAPVVLGLLLKSRSVKERLWWAAVFAATAAALVATGSRGAWLAFAVSLFVGAFMWNRRIALILLAAGIIGGVALLLIPHVPLVDKIKDRITNLFTVEYMQKSSEDGRIARWSEAYHVMRYEPLFGAGLGHHGGAVAARHFGTIYTDSYFFKTLAETGLIGIGLFVSLVVAALRYPLRVIRRWRGTEHFFLAVGLYGGLLAVALHNLVENIFEVPFMMLFFWLIAGFLCAFATEDASVARDA